MVYEQEAQGNHYNIYVISVNREDLAAAKAYWESSRTGFRLVGSYGSYSAGLNAARETFATRTNTGDGGNACNCVDGDGRRYREAFGQPCGTGGMASRDYNCR